MEMLTARDMQELLQVDRSTIYRMADAGQLPAVKVGKQWRFPRDKVEQWLQARSAASPVNSSAVTASPDATTSGNLTSLLPLECVQLIQDTFADTLGVMMVVTDMDGAPITRISNPCGLFSALHANPNALQQCIASWHRLAEAIELEPKFMPSYLGLLCARGFIRIGTSLKGMVVAGCVAPPDWPPSDEAVAQMAAQFGVETGLLRAHLSEVFFLDETQQARVLTTVQRVANIVAHIVNERYVLMEKLDTIARLVK